MANIILQCVYFILPAYFANMAPVVAKNMFRNMAFPIDFNTGMPFVPFDQLDFVFGALIFVYPVAKLSMEKIAIILFISFILHMVINHIAFYTGIRKERW